MPFSPVSLRLIVIAGITPEQPVDLDAVRAALKGGATLIQLRAKGLSDREILAGARTLLPVCRFAGVPLFINDRPDLVLAAGVDGVHVGPDDLSPRIARRILGNELGLGVSARTRERVRQAEEAHADYLGTGALHATPSKPEAEVLGFDGIAAIAAATAIPVVAIGGVRPEDISRLKQQGVSGSAVLGGILGTKDPEAAARSYFKAWESPYI